MPSADLPYQMCSAATRFVALLGAVASFGYAHPVAVEDLGADLPPALLATGISGLWRSTDGFATRMKVIDGAVDKVEFLTATAVIATGEKIWRSTDAGATFSVSYERKRASPSTLAVTRFSFGAGGVVGMAVAQSHWMGNVIDSTMLATTDGGATWAQRGRTARNGTGYVGIAALGEATEPHFARFAIAPGSGTVDVTTDLGASWVPTNVPNCPCASGGGQNGFDIDIFSTDAKGEVIILTGFGEDGALKDPQGNNLTSGVFLRSGDSGQNWTCEVPAPNAHVTTTTTGGGTVFYELASVGKTMGAPHDNSPMYAVAGAINSGDHVDSDNMAGYVSRSDDGGTTWETVYETFESDLRDLAVSSSRAGGLCAVGMRAALGPVPTQQAVVSCSVDGGKTWTGAPRIPFPIDRSGALWETLSIALA